MKTSVELKQLVGKHKLSGVDFTSEPVDVYDDGTVFEQSEFCRFKLDGKTYVAIQDPSDGYRSSMKEIYVTKSKLTNEFKPIDVFGIMKPESYGVNDVIQFYDLETALIVLEVGTENTNDYYPSWVATFTPENMIINKL